MNLLTLFLGVLVIAGGALSDHVPLSSLLNLTAFIIVMCGSFAACLLQFGLQKILFALQAIRQLSRRIEFSEAQIAINTRQKIHT